MSSAAVLISSTHKNFSSNSTHALTCELGSCHSLSLLHARFSRAVCGGVVPGLDIYWTSLMAILCLGLCVMILSLLLASRLTDFRQDRPNKFQLMGAVLRQARATLWYLVGVAVQLWFVVGMARDTYFREVFCGEGEGGGGGGGVGCCPECVWVFGVVFLVLSVLVGGVSRVYQCVILHRLSSEFNLIKWVGMASSCNHK